MEERREKRMRRRFTEEFKLEAVELSKKLGSASAAARELDIDAGSLRRWRKEFGSPDAACFEFPGQSLKTLAQYEKAYKKLVKENGYLREINRVLKKVRRFSHQIF